MIGHILLREKNRIIYKYCQAYATNSVIYETFNLRRYLIVYLKNPHRKIAYFVFPNPHYKLEYIEFCFNQSNVEKLKNFINII